MGSQTGTLQPGNTHGSRMCIYIYIYIYIHLYIFPLSMLLLLFFKNIYIFCGATVSFMLIVCSVVPSYVVPSEAPCDSELLWLLLCRW